jgi:hypothetical protein
MYIEQVSRREERQLKTVQQMDDPKRLLGIWHRRPFIDVRVAVVYKLKEQSLLERVALHDTYSEVRCEAVKKLTDMIVLAHIAQNDENEFVHFIAKRKLEYINGGASSLGSRAMR